MALELFRIHDDYDIFYVPDFLSALEQNHVLSKIYSQKWVALLNRRVQAHPSELLDGKTLIAAQLPRYLTDIVLDKFQTLGIFKDSPHAGPNHVLVNEYRPGQGIHAHEDGDVYFPLVATVTLGSHCIYNVYSKNAKRKLVARILQEPGSCMVTSGNTYIEYLHGIDAIERDCDLNEESVLNWDMMSPMHQHSELARQTRVSLTYRDVKSMKKVFGKR